MNTAETMMTMTTNRTTPQRGFVTSQLMIGVITYAAINKTAKTKAIMSRITFNNILTYTSLHWFYELQVD